MFIILAKISLLNMKSISCLNGPIPNLLFSIALNYSNETAAAVRFVGIKSASKGIFVSSSFCHLVRTDQLLTNSTWQPPQTRQPLREPTCNNATQDDE